MKMKINIRIKLSETCRSVKSRMHKKQVGTERKLSIPTVHV